MTLFWSTLSLFILVLWCMSMAQINAESQGNDYDLGFAILPRLGLTWATTTFWATASDLIVTICYVLFIFILLPLCCHDYWRCKIRFTLILTYLYFLRTLMLLSTRSTLILPSINALYQPPNTAFGAILIMLGIRTTQTDYLCSGHTLVWTLMMLFFWHYKKPTALYTGLSLIFSATCVAGMILLVGVREHYTVDVVVSIVVATLSFTVYHLCVWSSERRSKWWVVRVMRWIEKQ